MTTTTVNSFPPIANPTATTLILGSIPGEVSLKTNQYYAHPRNAFWPIMASIYHFNTTLSYPRRIKAIKKADVAIWDVLAQCSRSGSLDSAIKKDSRVPNNFGLFLQQHPFIQLVAFNGAEAEQSFQRYVLPDLNLSRAKLVRLPSTSPAHTIPFKQKESAWRTALSQ